MVSFAKYSGGSRGRQGRSPTPGHPNSFIFMQFSAKTIGYHPLWELAPPSGKSWIRHWPGTFCFLNTDVYLQIWLGRVNTRRNLDMSKQRKSWKQQDTGRNSAQHFSYSVYMFTVRIIDDLLRLCTHDAICTHRKIYKLYNRHVKRFIEFYIIINQLQHSVCNCQCELFKLNYHTCSCEATKFAGSTANKTERFFVTWTSLL